MLARRLAGHSTASLLATGITAVTVKWRPTLVIARSAAVVVLSLPSPAIERLPRPYGQAVHLQVRAMRAFLGDGEHAPAEAVCGVQEPLLEQPSRHVAARQATQGLKEEMK